MSASRSSFFLPLRSLALGWALSFAGWGLVTVAMTANSVTVNGEPWLAAARVGVREWLPWALLAPLLFWLVERLPVDRDRWKVALPVQVLVGVAVLWAGAWWQWKIDPPRLAAPGAWLPPSQRETLRQMESGPRYFGRVAVGCLGSTGFMGSLGYMGSLGSVTRSASNLAIFSAFRALFPPRLRPAARPPWFQWMGCDLPIYLLIVITAHAALFFRREQQRAGSLSQARLEALRTQLQPHFLFNTLNAIAGLVYHEPAKADAMLTALSDLLRLSLKTSDAQELPLAQELVFVRRYLDIMRARFEDRLNFRLEIGSDVRGALVPSLLLQPLVESAVRHGLEPQPEGGLVTVRAWREGGALRLTVEEIGTAARKDRPAGEGTAIGNARARLRELYGNRATFELRNGLGVIADISLPFRTAPPPLAA